MWWEVKPTSYLTALNAFTIFDTEWQSDSALSAGELNLFELLCTPKSCQKMASHSSKRGAPDMRAAPQENKVFAGDATQCDRPLRKQLCCTLTCLFLIWHAFYFFVVSLSFKSSLRQRFTTRPNSCRESCSGVNWSVSARLKLAGTSLVSTANHLAVMSPVAKRSSIEQ